MKSGAVEGDSRGEEGGVVERGSDGEKAVGYVVGLEGGEEGREGRGGAREDKGGGGIVGGNVEVVGGGELVGEGGGEVATGEHAAFLFRKGGRGRRGRRRATRSNSLPPP